MKIDIITFHFVQNYGAVLQAWALQEKLEQMNNEVLFIDYRPDYHTARYTVWHSLLRAFQITYNKYACKGFLYRVLRSLKAVCGTFLQNVSQRSDRIERKKAFDDFISKNLAMTKRYVTVDELKSDPPAADVFITGSDQVWNSKLTDSQLEDSYFLQFGDAHIKRLAYAVSIGETPPRECSDKIKGMLFPLDGLSCREKKDAKSLGNYLGRDCLCVPDPTVLLCADAYKKIEEAILLPQKYILVYILKENALLESIINVEKKRTGMTVIDISPISVKLLSADKKICVSPGQFVTCFKNASFVVTNSFHGTVFSCIYEREFVVGEYQNRNQRMEDLLQSLELDKRFVKTAEEFDAAVCEKMNFDIARNKLATLRSDGERFLIEQF